MMDCAIKWRILEQDAEGRPFVDTSIGRKAVNDKNKKAAASSLSRFVIGMWVERRDTTLESWDTGKVT